MLLVYAFINPLMLRRSLRNCPGSTILLTITWKFQILFIFPSLLLPARFQLYLEIHLVLVVNSKLWNIINSVSCIFLRYNPVFMVKPHTLNINMSGCCVCEYHGPQQRCLECYLDKLSLWLGGVPYCLPAAAPLDPASLYHPCNSWLPPQCSSLAINTNMYLCI